MFKFNPEDAKSVSFLFEPGLYMGRIEQSELTTSKAGNEMIHLTIKVSDGERTRLVDDYIVNPHSLWKLRNICEATGMDFTGELDENLLRGKTMQVKIKVRVDRDGKYDDKNEVARYMISPAAPEGATVKEAATATAEDVPF